MTTEDLETLPETTADLQGDADAQPAPDVTFEPDATAAPQADAPEAPTEEATPQAPSARPEGVPEKFWDPEEGALRTDALLKSYLELERKLGSMTALPADDDTEGQARLRRALGVPESPEDYSIEARHELVEPAAEINAKLHEAGFNQRQAQLVYDLAADYVLPMVEEMQVEVEAHRDAERLSETFGGKESWQRVARQMKTWGKANLSDDVMQVLASSYDGVLAMHQMMQAREPDVLRDGDTSKGEPDQGQLTAMMRDPRYWRDRDPTVVAKVTQGFKQLYGE